MMKNLLLIAIGGAAGSVGRYVVSKCFESNFPWGTITVNILGSLLIGFFIGLLSKGTLSPEMKMILVTGFCGGFTTFSTFANESFNMMKTGNALLAAIYIGASMTIGIIAVYIGMLISK